MSKVRVGRISVLFLVAVLLPGMVTRDAGPGGEKRLAYVDIDADPDTSSAFLNGNGTAAFRVTNQSSATETFTFECFVDGTYAKTCSVNLPSPYQKTIFGNDFEFVMVSWTSGNVEGDGWVRLRATDSDLYFHVSNGDAVASVRANAGPPDVTPDNGTATDTFPVLNETVPFWLHNSGTQAGDYDLSCGSSTGVVVCSMDPSTVTINVPGNDSVSVDVPYGTTDWGSGTLQVTVDRIGEATDTGQYTLTIDQPEVPGAPDVALVGTPVSSIETSSTVNVDFQVENTGNGQGTYDLTCETGGQLTNCQAPASVTIAGLQTTPVQVAVSGTGTPGSGGVTLEAVLQNDTLSDVAGHGIDVVAPQGIPVVQATSGAASFTAGTPGNTVQFSVSGLATSSGQHTSLNYAVACTAGPNVTITSCPSINPASGATQSKQVAFDVGSPIDSTTVTLTVTRVQGSYSDGDSHMFDIVAPVLEQYMNLDTSPTADYTRPRQSCVTAAAGPEGAMQCGSLRLAHVMPSFRTLGQEHTTGLTYVSDRASPAPIVMADITGIMGLPAMDSVIVRLRMNGTTTETVYRTNLPTAGNTRRVSVVRAWDPAEGATGIYAYELEAEGYVGDTPCTGCFVSDSSYVAVLNDPYSPMGPGWQVLGLSKLVVNGSAPIVLVESDGSTTTFFDAGGGGNVWASNEIAFPNTIVWEPSFSACSISGAFFVRELRQNLRILYDSVGSLRWIIDRNCQRVEYTHTALADAGAALLDLPGTAGNYVTNPSFSAVESSGDIDVRVHLAADEYDPTGTTYLLTKYEPGGDQRSWKLGIAAGKKPTFTWSTDGTAAGETTVTAASGIGVANAEKAWVRARLDVSDLGQHIVSLFWSADGQHWGEIGTDTISGTTSVHAGTAPIEVGSHSSGSGSSTGGKYFRAQIFADGAPVWDANFRDPDAYDGTFTTLTPVAGTGPLSLTGSGISVTREDVRALSTIRIAPYSENLQYRFHYSAARLDSIVDPAGRKLGVAYDLDGRLEELADPGFASDPVKYTYDSQNLITVWRSRALTEWNYSYGSGGVLSSVSGPHGFSASFTAVTSYGFGGGNMATPGFWDVIVDGPRDDVTDVTRFKVDRYGAPTQIQDALGNTTAVTYVPGRPGLPSSIAYPNGLTTTAQYDGRGNPTLVTSNGTGAGASQTAYTYGDSSWPDLPTRITQPTGEYIDITYDPANGNRLTQRDPRGASSEVTYTYHVSGAKSGLVKTVDPPGSVPPDSIYYDSRGNVSSTVSAMGFTTTYAYDNHGNLSERTYPIDAAQTLHGVERTTHDVLNRPTLVRTVGPAVTYTLPGSSPTTVPADSFEVENVYDLEGNLTKVTRTALGQTAGPAIVVREMEYDDLGRMTAEKTPGAGILGDDSYQYDKAGNVIQYTTKRGHTILSEYDELDRLTKRITPQVVHQQSGCTEHPAGGGCDYVFPIYPTQSTDGQPTAYDLGNHLPSLSGEYAIDRSNDHLLELEAPGNFDPNGFGVGAWIRADFNIDDGLEHTLFTAYLDSSNWYRVVKRADSKFSFKARIQGTDHEAVFQGTAKQFQSGDHFYVGFTRQGSGIHLFPENSSGLINQSGTASGVGNAPFGQWRFFVGSDEAGGTPWDGAVQVTMLDGPPGGWTPFQEQFNSGVGVSLSSWLGPLAEGLVVHAPFSPDGDEVVPVTRYGGASLLDEDFNSTPFVGWPTLTTTQDPAYSVGGQGITITAPTAGSWADSPTFVLHTDGLYAVAMYSGVANGSTDRPFALLTLTSDTVLTGGAFGEIEPRGALVVGPPNHDNSATRLRIGLRSLTTGFFEQTGAFDEVKVVELPKLTWTTFGQEATSLAVAADTAVFEYDVMGNMIRADNKDARVRRTYTLDGSIKTDSTWIRDYLDDDFDNFKFGITHSYDLSGRLASSTHPSNFLPGSTGQTTYSYDPQIGALERVTSRTGNVFEFSYDYLNRPEVVTYPGNLTEELHYDDDGRLINRDKGKAGLVLNDDALEFDARGRVTRAEVRPEQTYEEVVNNYYGGLGALAANSYYRAQDNYTTYEEFDTDALQNREASVRSTGVSQPQDGQYHPGYVYNVDLSTGQLLSRHSAVPQTGESGAYPDSIYRVYDTAGNVEFSGSVAYTTDEFQTIELKSRTASRHFYDAAEQLVAVQKYAFEPEGSVGTNSFGTWEEYRYDALGRRVLVRNRPDSLCDQSSRCKPFIQRTVWDGNKILLEMRVESSDATQASSPGQLDQIWTGGEQYGRVAYTHGAALDRPLDITKHDGSSPSVIVPHYNWRGLAEAVTDTTGARLCPAATGCPTNKLPGSYATAFRGDRNGQGSALPQWWGALIVDQQDQSGLLYRRNRYYDATTGQFTQEDPIGLAGGLNLYGFANGDPINFSDPFGLCADQAAPDDDAANKQGGDPKADEECDDDQVVQVTVGGSLAAGPGGSGSAGVFWDPDQGFPGGIGVVTSGGPVVGVSRNVFFEVGPASRSSRGAVKTCAGVLFVSACVSDSGGQSRLSGRIGLSPGASSTTGPSGTRRSISLLDAFMRLDETISAWLRSAVGAPGG